MEPPVLLPVSAVAEFMYCPRNFYYRMVEGAEEKNAAMIEGALQEQAREERSRQIRGDAVQLRQIRMASLYYGLTAELDVMEEIPVYFCQYGGRLTGWLQPMKQSLTIEYAWKKT